MGVVMVVEGERARSPVDRGVETPEPWGAQDNVEPR